MALLNQFGKKRWRSIITSEAALNAGVARMLSISDANVDDYGPFTRLHLENKNTTITLEVDLNASALGDNSVTTATHRIFMLPSTVIEIVPEEDPDKIFYRITIKNTHGSTNTSAGDIVWSIANY